jgi:2-(3-amino-3-carboxypropyl)histidine synthase
MASNSTLEPSLNVDVEVYGDGFFSMQRVGQPAEGQEAVASSSSEALEAAKDQPIEDPAIKSNEANVIKPKAPRKRFVGAARAAKNPTSDSSISIEDSTAVEKSVRQPATTRLASSIPSSILDNPQLNEAISILPKNYNFEIHKSMHAIKSASATRVGLQMPEGLLMYACTISDILSGFAGVECVILGDVTYGACCVDDYTAVAAGCDFLIHYGHSCLVPVNVTKVKALYVFVDIGVDVEHFVETVKLNFVDEKTGRGGKVVMVATIQFIASLQVR